MPHCYDGKKKRGEKVNAEVKYNVTINLDKPNHVTIIARQLDDRLRVIYFHLVASGKAYSMSRIYAGSLKAIKPSGAIVFDDIEISDGVVRYEIPKELTDEPGTVCFEVELFGTDNETISTDQMEMEVKRTTFDETELITQDYIEGFRGYMTATYNLYQKSQENLSNIELMYGSFNEIQGELEAAKQEYVTYMTELQEKVKNGAFNGSIGPKGEDGAAAVVAEVAGIIAFQIENGKLMCYYYDITPPPFEIDENGNLIYRIGG